MIKLLFPLNRQLNIACSGGIDSMAVVDFLSRSHQIKLLHFNHGTNHGKLAQEFVESYANERKFPINVGKLSRFKNKDESWEEFWRNERYKFFNESAEDSIITCHHLNDVIETWIFSSLHGEGKIIPHKNGIIIRPFLLNSKQEFHSWCQRKNVPWIEDESNLENIHMRNKIRNQIIPLVKEINPGIEKVMIKKIMKAKLQ